jgi:curved DNA-binding protein CbpA
LRTADSQTRKSPKESHEILEVAPNASPEEIHRAFRRLAAQYHPDKVAHLGAEFGELAEARFKEIQQAYDHLMDKKNQR